MAIGEITFGALRGGNCGVILSSTFLGPGSANSRQISRRLSAGYRSLYGRPRPLGACRTLSAIKGTTARRTFTPIFAAVNGRKGAVVAVNGSEWPQWVDRRHSNQILHRGEAGAGAPGGWLPNAPKNAILALKSRGKSRNVGNVQLASPNFGFGALSCGCSKPCSGCCA